MTCKGVALQKKSRNAGVSIPYKTGITCRPAARHSLVSGRYQNVGRNVKLAACLHVTPRLRHLDVLLGTGGILSAVS